MLSRVADALFWMSRYVERAGQIARLLDVSFLLDLDLHGALADQHELQWSAVLSILQQPLVKTDGQPLAAQVSESLTFDMQNGGSIMTCVNRARNNARSIRGSISSEMWRELNKLYWQLSDAEFRSQFQDSPHDLFQAVQIGSQLFQGLCDASLTHDEGWHFIQLGKYLERADKTLRIIDAKHQQLCELEELAELSLSNLHWAGVLKSCGAYEAYQRLYISRVEPEQVLEFLLFNPDFPHSVRHCLESAARALKAIGVGRDGDSERPGGRAARVLGRAISDLEYAELDQVLATGLKHFLDGTAQRCSQACIAVQEQYALRA